MEAQPATRTGAAVGHEAEETVALGTAPEAVRDEPQDGGDAEPEQEQPPTRVGPAAQDDRGDGDEPCRHEGSQDAYLAPALAVVRPMP